MFAAGRANTPASTPAYIEEVFSTTLYTGTSAARAITNDIALGSTAAWKTRTFKDGTTTTIYKVRKDTAGNYIALGNSTVSGTVGAVLIKFDSSWNITWQNRIATSGSVGPSALTLDTSDNIYIAYNGEVTGESSLAKFNSSGTLQWARNIGKAGGAIGNLTTIIYNTVDGYLYVGGRTGISGGGGPGLYAKYSTAGTVQWVKRFKPPGTYYGNLRNGQVFAMAHDSAGDVYIVGADFPSTWAGIVIKINSSGVFQWQKNVSASTQIEAIHIDSSDGIYISHWDGTVFSSSSYEYSDAITTKLNTSGTIVWTRKYRGYPDANTTLTGDASGNVYTAFGRTLTKHNSSGTLQWSRRLFTSIIAGLSLIDSTLYVNGIGTTNGFITELAPDGTTASGNAYHSISGDATDAASSTSLSNASSEVVDHGGTEASTSPAVTTASTTATLYSQAAVIGSGGMVWIKSRTSTAVNNLWDTARTPYHYLVSNDNVAQQSVSSTNALTSFNVNGFTLNGASNAWNGAQDYFSWTFREQRKFFDVVTYTGNGTAGRQIAHNLGSVPGCIFVKQTNVTGENWDVYHRSLANNKQLYLNTTNAELTTSSWNSTTPTSTVFTVGDGSSINASGSTYVAYLFAHDAGGFGLTGTDNVISCGSFTTDSGGNATVTLGYEPAWLMFKCSSNAGQNWEMIDTMRGWSMSTDVAVQANSSAAEASGGYGNPTATGFVMGGQGNTQTYIYMAIRRGPMKVPTVATNVFSIDTYNQTSASDPAFNLGKVADAGLRRIHDFESSWTFQSRLTENGGLITSSTNAESTQNYGNWDNNVGWHQGGAITPPYSQANYYGWTFARAPSFFDQVCYTGTGSLGNTLTHNLGVTPELMIVKCRSNDPTNWTVYTSTTGNTAALILNDSGSVFSGDINYWNNTSPTATQFTVGLYGTVNGSARTYVAYLFATCAGVSKVGSYTGTGTTLQINCGFTAGARFIIIKRTDSTGDWYEWDTARGIISGNDPYLLLNSTAVAVTNTDYIDPYNAGFEISSTAPSAINASGGTYIFLAIA